MTNDDSFKRYYKTIAGVFYMNIDFSSFSNQLAINSIDLERAKKEIIQEWPNLLERYKKLIDENIIKIKDNIPRNAIQNEEG